MSFPLRIGLHVQSSMLQKKSNYILIVCLLSKGGVESLNISIVEDECSELHLKCAAISRSSVPGQARKRMEIIRLKRHYGISLSIYLYTKHG